MNHLDQLEQQSVYIFREAYRHFERLCMLWSIGKDSTVLLWLARKAFFGHVPFPLVHIDTSYKIPEMIQYRDKLAMEYKLTMVVGQNKEVLKSGKTFPLTEHLPDSDPNKITRQMCCGWLKKDALTNTLNGTWDRNILNLKTGKYEVFKDRDPYHGVIVGARADEEGSRSKERYFSPRDKNNLWDIGEQPPEFWNQFKTDFAPGTHVRVHPLLDWTELNIWEYIKRENIPTVSLYYDRGEGTRYRSLGCAPCQAPIQSKAKNVDDVIKELKSGTLKNVAERAGRLQDGKHGLEEPSPRRLHVMKHEQMNIVIVGHVDHGKSTVLGRLLADTGSLPEGKLEAVRKECERTGKPFEYAFLLDALSDEQDQGITIDTARSFFKTKKRDYIIIDAPGHIEFLKNMISGAARAEAAVLIIDAKEGVQENSRRHGYILSMLGIKQTIVCVNKMDLVNRDKTVFQRIEKEFRKFLKEIGSAEPKQFIPVSAIEGDNLATKSKAMPWYKGPSLLQALDSFKKAPPKNNQPFRMPVQAVYKFTKEGDDRRIIAGRIEAGKVKVGDKVIFSPSNKTSKVKSIEGFNTSKRTSIEAGWSTGFVLSEEIFVTRGEIMSLEKKQPQVSPRFRANLIWLSKKPLVMGRDYKLKIHTQSEPVRIHTINKVIDASSAGSKLKKKQIDRHDVADVMFEARRPLAYDLISDNDTTGRFVLVDGYDIAGGGIIVESAHDENEKLRAEAQNREMNWIRGGVSTQERADRFKHQPVLMMFLGKRGVGKHKLARAVERALFEKGMSSYMLDGTNVLSDKDMNEKLVRRFSDMAHLLLDAGHIVVSTTNSIGLADFSAVQALIPDYKVLTIDIDPSGSNLSPSDIKLSGKEKEQAVINQIFELLKDRAIL